MLASGKLRRGGMAASRAWPDREAQAMYLGRASHTARVTATECKRRLIFGTTLAWSDWGPETLTGLALSVL